MCGVRTRSMRRGSAMMRCAPWRSRRFIWEANTGWPSVGLAPMTRITSALMTESKFCARAGVDVVVAEAGTDQLLHEVGLLVRAARGGDAADRVAAVFRLDALQLARGIGDG